MRTPFACDGVGIHDKEAKVGGWRCVGWAQNVSCRDDDSRAMLSVYSESGSLSANAGGDAGTEND